MGRRRAAAWARAAPIVAGDGEVLGVSSVARDITAEMRSQEALKKSERQLYDAQALAHVGSLELDISEGRAVLSTELCRILGRQPDFWPTVDELTALVHDDDREVAERAIRDATSGMSSDTQFRILRPDGVIRYVHSKLNPRRSPNGSVSHVFGAVQDITDRKQYEADLERLATHDSLTGLPNRRVFDERIEAEIARSKRHGRPLSLAILDIDNFKRINDQLGHPVGDEVLAHVGEVLAGQVRTHELMSRVGGEEFAWILPDATQEGALAAVRRCIAAVAAIDFSYLPKVTMSGGVCTTDGSMDLAELYRRSDSALLAAKQAGRNRIIVDPGDPGLVTSE
jgi:diguanylate cyclase (GGDEF)-like protein/PAS domain S-box-containing protein